MEEDGEEDEEEGEQNVDDLKLKMESRAVYHDRRLLTVDQSSFFISCYVIKKVF